MERNIEKYLSYCKWIKVSINGGNRETYKNIHRVDHFDNVVQNMLTLSYAKTHKNLKCTLGAQMVLLNENIDSAEELVQVAYSVGFDYVVFKPYSQHLKSNTKKHANVSYQDIEMLEKKLGKYRNTHFDVIIRSKSMERWNKKVINFSSCHVTPFFWAYIEATGDVYVCSCFLGDKRFCIGNINEQSFSEIWQSQERQRVYEMMKNFDVKNCRVNCRMAECNEYLERLLNPLDHDNFI